MAFQENKNLIIKSARNGFGIFTKRLFARNEAIFQITGSLITGDIDEDIDDTTRSNAIRYDENYYISPAGKIADFLNHSCNPNAKVVKRGKKLFVVAIKSISKNREVVVDYSTITAADDIWTMRCNCGSVNCRKLIKRFHLLSSEIKKYYSKRHIVPDYIQNI